jgi:hypothetical protein
MSEQLRFDEVARDRCHIDRNEGSTAPFAVIVERASDELLAGTGFTADHHREIGLHQASENAVDFLHGWRTANQRDRFKVLWLCYRARALLGLRQGAPDNSDQLLEIERFGQILVGALFRCPHGSNERILRAHDDHGQFGPHFLYARQEIERILVRHDDIGDDEIPLALTDPAPQGCSIAG